VLVTIVNACLRDGRGGSPTAVAMDAPLSDDERRVVPVAAGTSHAVFVSPREHGGGVSLRFFTAEGELPACGHGTVAALAFLAEQGGADLYATTLHGGGRSFAGHAVRGQHRLRAAFEPGAVNVRDATLSELDLIRPALGLSPEAVAAGATIASLGRARALIPVPARDVLAAVRPDHGRLQEVCDRLDLLGCYVHTTPASDGHAAARMFAPSIGVPEDIANANSTACLAVQLGRPEITVDMGDALGHPATVTATVSRSPGAARVTVGGAAEIAGTVRLELDRPQVALRRL
jgi:PhzF family phenazine biosynthesis protein